MVSPSMVKWGLDVSKAPAAVQASREPIIRFFSYHDAHPVALTMVLMEKFGTEWFEWEPETLQPEILTTFKATSISEHNWQKIQAVRSLTNAIGFWKEWHIFEKIVQALNNNVPRFDIAQRCTVAQLMAGVDIVGSIRNETYSDEVERYIAACSMDEGITYLPPPIDFAQTVLSEPSYLCKVCGNIDVDDLDGRCDFCTGRFADRRDPAPVKKRFNELKKDGGKIRLNGESPEDVQAAKLMVAYEYMQHRQQQLVEQLEELKTWVTH
jgi:hypothetical protein